MSLIIVPTDFSFNAEKALRQAVLLADRHNDQIELLHVIELTRYQNMPQVLGVVMGGQKEEEARLKDFAQASIDVLDLEKPVRWRLKVMYAEDIYKAICQRFRNCKAKLVVMGTHGVSGFSDKIFGTNTANLIERAEVPVLTIPPDWTLGELEKLTVCVEPGNISSRTKLIRKWSEWFGCPVEGVYFTGMPTGNKAVKSPFPFQTIPSPIETPLYQDLVEYSGKLKSTALTMFIHKRSFLDKLLDSSITQKVAGRIQIPLLALPIPQKK